MEILEFLGNVFSAIGAGPVRNSSGKPKQNEGTMKSQGPQNPLNRMVWKAARGIPTQGNNQEEKPNQAFGARDDHAVKWDGDSGSKKSEPESPKRDGNQIA